MRMNYYHENRSAIDAMSSVKNHITSIEPKLKALIELRVSQINYCTYCVDLHSMEARKAGEDQQRLDALCTWRESPFFEAKERAALAWAEAVTNIDEGHAADALYDDLTVYFSKKEIVDLTLIISMMNAWNRLAISFRKLPQRRSL